MKYGGTSRASVLRLTKEINQNKPAWTIKLIKETKRGNLFHKRLLEYFIPKWCLDRLDEFEEHQSDMRNLIAVLEDHESLPYHLYKMKWDIFGTIAYKGTYSAERCYNEMSKLSEKIESKLPSNIEYRLFFTTEKFTTREGHHNHFFLRVGNFKFREYITEYIENSFENDRTDIQSYDHEKAGLFYICKNNNLKGLEWDIRGNNLNKIEFN
jgi:hypothetical protein